jgi:hypothetical protein
MQLHEMCALMQHALLSASQAKFHVIELFDIDKIDKMPSEWSDTEKQSL